MIRPFWMEPGVWIAIMGGILMAANAMRATIRPVAFAEYLGLPLADARDAALIRVYALRAAFVTLTLIILLAAENTKLLGAVCLAAVVMAAGDAWLTSHAKAKPSTIARHVAIATLLLAAGTQLILS